MALFDSHCHLADWNWLKGAGKDFLKCCQANGERWICMSCDADEWALVSDLTCEFPTLIVPAFGIHPWKVHSLSFDTCSAQNITRKLFQMLQKHPDMIIGEVGLDFHSNRIPPELSSDEIQQWRTKQCEVLSVFIDFAEAYNRPISMHCVKAFDALQLMNLLSRNVTIMFHSYSGNLEITSQIMRSALCKCYFSFSNMLNRKSLRKQVLELIGVKRILIESDLTIEDKEKNPSCLAEILEGIANILPAFTKEIGNSNFNSFLSVLS